MACQVGAKMLLQSRLCVIESEVFERSNISLTICAMQKWSTELNYSGQLSKNGVKSASFLNKRFRLRQYDWRIPFALDTGGLSGNGGEQNGNRDESGLGSTRLGRIVSAGGRQLLQKLNSARKNFPMKVFLILLGFYTANALATILGQTGDWDVLVAGVVVAAIEGIGMLMYKKPIGRLQSFVVMINYWKAGVCLGLFVDAFKLGS
ncbi:ycf20-like protein isoform X2 [Mercurialis annua]|uniref:ycf20-like protein isoform X2 n=1 Tax=Mercurialis annua TaxID=3986 RepID=UPI0021604714|nr:ycf20-like protein isoform X2 [Mercurialis annua]